MNKNLIVYSLIRAVSTSDNRFARITNGKAKRIFWEQMNPFYKIFLSHQNPN